MTESQRKNAESQRKLTDREYVIRRLAEVSEYTRAKADIAGVGKGKEIFDSWYRAAEDAIAMLREQEPVAAEHRDISIDEYIPLDDEFWCKGCGCYWISAIDETVYCPHCGKAVKWDEP